MEQMFGGVVHRQQATGVKLLGVSLGKVHEGFTQVFGW